MNLSQAKKWLSKNYTYVIAVGGVYALYKIVKYFSGEDIDTNTGFSKEMKYPKLMGAILKGESHSYNDHNYYNPNLGGYSEGGWGRKYGALVKNLSDYTIGEIQAFQRNSRSSGYGQLWAVGKYQMIPTTFASAIKTVGLKPTDKFNESNQDKLGMALLKNRVNLWKYITKQVPDSQTTLNAAAFDIAQEWSSVGMPYARTGFWRVPVAVNESFYKPNDRATTKTEDVQKALKEARNS
jgi:hypothetical protein